MNGRLPKRSEKTPASGATTIVAPVHTSSFRPACSGVFPSTFCMYCERKKIEPNIPKYMLSEATLVTAKERLAKNDIGSIGSLVRSSQHDEAREQAARRRSSRPAPWRSSSRATARARARTRPRRRPCRRAPGRAGRACRRGRGSRVSRRAASGIRTSPIGTLIQKIQCQEMPCTTAPPTSGPIATAIPLMPDHTPIAIPRCSAGKASASSVSVSGVTIAAPAPWTARAATSRPVFGASAAAAEAAVKIDRPITNMRLRPKRSPSAAPVSSSTA